MLTDERLIAYADGEVSGEDARAIEAVLKTRPDLQAFVETQRALREHFGESFAPLMSEAVPDRLSHALTAAPMSPRWRLKQWAQAVASRRFLLWSAIPAAAALACGLVIGVLAVPQGSFRIDRDTGVMVARGALSTALDQRLASSQDATKNIRVGLSFKAKDGRYCRTFDASAVAGVACHDQNGWAVAALASTPAESFPYRMAGAMPDAVRHTVEKMIAGEPLDAAQEQRARYQKWQAR